MRTGKIKGRIDVIVISFVIIGLMSRKLYYNSITKNPAKRFLNHKKSSRNLIMWDNSKTKQYKKKACANAGKKKNRQRREARQRFVVHPTGFEPVAF